MSSPDHGRTSSWAKGLRSLATSAPRQQALDDDAQWGAELPASSLSEAHRRTQSRPLANWCEVGVPPGGHKLSLVRQNINRLDGGLEPRMCANVTTLLLSHNTLCSLDGVQQFAAVQQLALAFNQLTSVPTAAHGVHTFTGYIMVSHSGA